MKARNLVRLKTTAHRDEILVACSETIRLINDKVIEQHGDWPGAFVVKPTSKEQ